MKTKKSTEGLRAVSRWQQLRLSVLGLLQQFLCAMTKLHASRNPIVAASNRRFAFGFVPLVLLLLTIEATRAASSLSPHFAIVAAATNHLQNASPQNVPPSEAPNPNSTGSGVTYWPARDTYLLLDNNPRRILEFSRSHVYQRTILMTGFGDPEDIQWISGNTFVIAQEFNSGSVDELVVIDLPISGSAMNISTNSRRLTVGGYLTTTANKGIEAVTVINNNFYFTTEYAPTGPSGRTWSVWTVPNSGNGAVTPTVAFNLPTLLSGRATDMSGMATDGTDLWLLSHEGSGGVTGRVVRVTTSGTFIAEYQLPNFANGAFWQQAEGICLFVDPTDSTLKMLLTGEYSAGGSTGVDFMLLTATTPSAAYARADITTQGNWINNYGSQGYHVIGDGSASYPSYAEVSAFTPNLEYDWWESPYVGGLQRASNPSQTLQYTIHSTDYGSGADISFTINFTDGQTHQLALYAYDFDASVWLSPRTQTYQIENAYDSTVLSSKTVNSFEFGQYMVWNVQGKVRVRVIQSSGINAVLSGVFIDPPQQDFVWFDNNGDLSGSVFVGTEGDPWQWVTSPVFSGANAHISPNASGMHQHYFYGAPITLQPKPNQSLFTQVRVDGSYTLPDEVMLQWYSPSLFDWRRAFWGDDLLWPGVQVSASIPTQNQWVLLEVPAWQLGLVSRTIEGMAFTMENGQAVWDRAGIKYMAASSDTDADGLPDDWETLYFGGLSERTNDDYDGDGLSNRLELLLNSNPNAVNTDGEGDNDGEEVYWSGTDPSLPDTDGDWYYDGDELYIYSTDPLDPGSHP